MKKYFKLWTITGIILLVLSVVFYLQMGYTKIPFKEVIEVLKGSDTTSNWYIINEVRLPRILTSILIGSILSMCGLVFQGVLLNPLADPYTLGISSGASFGAALGLVLNITFLGVFSIHIFSFIFSILCLVVVIKMGSFEKKMNPISIILGGVIVGAFFSAGLSFLKYIADEGVASIVFWLMGSFVGKSWLEVGILTVVWVFGFIIFYYYAEDLNILALGEKSAISLGLNPSKIRKILLVVSSILSAVAVSTCGIIGFVGLVVPHLLRFILGTDNKKLIIGCAIWGGVIMGAADNIVRVVLPHDIPVGVITSLIGAPFFALIFRKKMGGGNLR
ncbi:MAG: iron ABC transporter permease [Psychrilyobacter sp.]|nr:iron ABC transporter permease [Psychrilyobacter sp.]